MRKKILRIVQQTAEYKPFLSIFGKTFLSILLLTPALTFWYVLLLLLVSQRLPASLGIGVLTISDVICLPVVCVFAVIVGVMSLIYFLADMLEQPE